MSCGNIKGSENFINIYAEDLEFRINIRIDMDKFK